MGRRLLAAQCVLDAADGVLHLAFYLVALALGFQLGIAQYLASNFLHFALGLFSRALDAVFVHFSLHMSPPSQRRQKTRVPYWNPAKRNKFNDPTFAAARARAGVAMGDAKNPPARPAGSRWCCKGALASRSRNRSRSRSRRGARRGAAGVAQIFERRQCLELVLSHVHHGMIGIFAIFGRGRCRGGGFGGHGRSGRGRPCRGGGRGAGGARLHEEFDLVPRQADVALANSQEAADADHDDIELAGSLVDEFVDVADLLVVAVVDIQADQLRRAPSSQLLHLDLLGGGGVRSGWLLSGLCESRGG